MLTNIMMLIIAFPFYLLIASIILFAIFKTRIIGNAGEYRTKQVLDTLDKNNYFIIHDLMIRTKNNITHQIDHVVISKYGIHVIETKQYNGYIVGNEYDKQWKMNKKYSINNPTHQNYGHVESLKEVLNMDDKYFYNIVCFPSNTKLRVKSSKVVNRDKLINKILSNNETIINNPEEIFNKLVSLNILDKKQRQDHIRYAKNVRYSKENKDNKNILLDGLKEQKNTTIKIFSGIITFYVVIGLLGIIVTPSSNQQTNVINNNITANQKEALQVLKNAYNNSKRDGFEIMHMSVCNEISGMLNNKLNCTNLPLEVNYEDEHEITIYKDFICYRIKLNEDKTKIESANYKYVAYDKTNCSGQTIGYLDWDPDNEFYIKIGGYDKIREMSLYAYNNNSFVTNYYDGLHIVERGGEQSKSTLYKMNIDMFYSAVTGKGYSIRMDNTNRENTNKMCESFYYMMK